MRIANVTVTNIGNITSDDIDFIYEDLATSNEFYVFDTSSSACKDVAISNVSFANFQIKYSDVSTEDFFGFFYEDKSDSPRVSDLKISSFELRDSSFGGNFNFVKSNY